MTDHPKAETTGVTQISADDPIFAAFGVDPENAAAALHQQRQSSRWLPLAILGILAPLAGFVAVHWPAMAAHAATTMAMTETAATPPTITANNAAPGGTPAPAGSTAPGGSPAVAAHICGRDITGQSPFNAAMTKAMMDMHMAMDLPYSGDADRDFARMMIPHHQGAIDMAMLEMTYGKDARLRRLAQEIIVTQQQEIAVMQLALQQTALADPQSPVAVLQPTAQQSPVQ